MSAYDRLADYLRATDRLRAASGLLGWDQETLMPPGGSAHRGAVLAELAAVLHRRESGPELGDLLAAAEAEAEAECPGVDSVATHEAARDLRLARLAYEQATRLPVELVTRIAEQRTRSMTAWQRAREEQDFKHFLGPLDQTLRLQQELADTWLADPPPSLSQPWAERWDVLAEQYERGLRATDVERVFARLMPPLAELTDALLEQQARLGTAEVPDHHVPRSVQEPLITALLSGLGFDWGRGRLDASAHPFCSGTHPTDVRLTTCYRSDDLFDSLGSAVHEAGHGMYEQGLPLGGAGLPHAAAAGLSIHESQSRLWENHVGRSEAFWAWALPRLQAVTGDTFTGLTPADVGSALNRVQPSLIRIQADEATYHQHIGIRFHLERRLLNGDLDAAELPEAWNTLYHQRLGVVVPDDASGCLQDIHWSMGAFGYFPTYTLGTLYAAQFFAAAEGALGPQAQAFASGDFAPLLGWLRTHVHAAGSLYDTDDLCRRVTGSTLDPVHFLDHLRGRLD